MECCFRVGQNFILAGTSNKMFYSFYYYNKKYQIETKENTNYCEI